MVDNLSPETKMVDKSGMHREGRGTLQPLNVIHKRDGSRIQLGRKRDEHVRVAWQPCGPQPERDAEPRSLKMSELMTSDRKLEASRQCSQPGRAPISYPTRKSAGPRRNETRSRADCQQYVGLFGTVWYVGTYLLQNFRTRFRPYRAQTEQQPE